jgi:hypothetical protein
VAGRRSSEKSDLMEWAVGGEGRASVLCSARCRSSCRPPRTPALPRTAEKVLQVTGSRQGSGGWILGAGFLLVGVRNLGSVERSATRCGTASPGEKVRPAA